MKAIVDNKTEFQIEKTRKGLFLNRIAVDWDLVRTHPQRYHVIFQHKSYTIDIISSDLQTKTFELKINNTRCAVQVKDKFDDLLHELGMDTGIAGKVSDIKAPMPGLVVEVKVSNGQEIKKGDPVIVLEAMKMENILKATADAVVKSVIVKKGSKVEKNEVLVTLQ